ncbi:hypothetical protein LCGC14_2748600 [marine sediment metagenome]|uniref:Uncharacterized protein n=1 Tax=marine sediment metagenome TaxID=412755 RepID=A0A0F8Z2M5_9ZZZZ
MEYLLEALITIVLALLIWLIIRTKRLSDTSIATDKIINDIQLIHKRLVVGLAEFDKTMNTVIVSSLPRDGFPHQVEACWEDVGARGRFLTDLGGMSEAMKDEMFAEFIKALDKPIPTTPAAGSFNDIMLDLDAWLTKQYLQEDDEFVLLRRSNSDATQRNKTVQEVTTQGTQA